MCCAVLCGCSKRQDQVKASIPQAMQQNQLTKTSLETQLFDAICNHDEATVKQLIAQGVNVNAHRQSVCVLFTPAPDEIADNAIDKDARYNKILDILNHPCKTACLARLQEIQ